MAISRKTLESRRRVECEGRDGRGLICSGISVRQTSRIVRLGIRESGSPYLFIPWESFLHIRRNSGTVCCRSCNGVCNQIVLAPMLVYDRTMFPFERPTSYGEMLNKIGLFTFFLTLGLTCVVAYFSPAAATFLNSQHTTVEILTLKVPLLYVVPAVGIAILARIIRLHDKISDLFGIRAKFDLYRILIPLCGSVEISVDEEFREKLRSHRNSALAKTFYRYASFEEPKISRALVLEAIDRWTWYWVLLEFTVVLLIADVTLLVLRAYAGASLISIAVFLPSLLFSTYDNVCGRLADAQIEEIVADDARAADLRTAFSQIRAHV
jgi:hypothetical protein